MTTTTQTLGKRQQQVYDILTGKDPHYPATGGWSDESPWYWGSPSQTDRICDALAKRGLVVKVRTSPSGYGVYRLPS